jgi:hypothetical protein
MNAIASQRAHLRALEKLLARKRAVVKAQKSGIASHKHTHSSQDTASAQLLHQNPSPRASSFHAFTEPLFPQQLLHKPALPQRLLLSLLLSFGRCAREHFREICYQYAEDKET